MTDDLVKRLRRDAKAAQWTTEPPESAPEVDPEDALAAADRIEELEKRLREWATNEETARREALEEAARVADGLVYPKLCHCEKIAAAILALKEK